MDSYQVNTLKSEKSGIILLFNNLKCIAKLFRIVEILLVLVFLSWTITRLPFAVKISGEYFRLLIAVMFSPLFTFLVCNVIVLTLFLKAGHFLVSQPPVVAETDSDIYQGTDFTNGVPSLVSDPDEVEYQDKEMIFEESSIITKVTTGYFDYPANCEIALKNSQSVVSDVPEMKPENTLELKDLKRSLSEVEVDYKEAELSHGKLRRSETEKWRKVSNPGEIPEETVYVFDELSNEEFQRTIEAFIERQIQFHHEEKFAIVLT